MNSLKILSGLLATASFATIAHAQDTVPAAGSTDTNAPDPNAEAPERGEIVVTGSRIVRDGADAPTPVTVVAAESLAQIAPSNIPDGLNQLPQFNNSSNQVTGATFQAGRGPTGNLLNLRSLGSERVLVLFNGNRVAPTGPTNAIDTNMLPQLLVERVDVVTGGVSAVYGSDGVSGAVNFVLDEDFTGIKGVAQAGISDKGDNFAYRIGAAAGIELGESIHVLASYEHYDSNGVGSLYARDWAPDTPVRTGNGASIPYESFANGLFTNISYGGLITDGPLEGMTFNPDGTLRPFDEGLPTLAAQAQVGGDGIKFGDAESGTVPLSTPLTTDQAFGRIAFDVSDAFNVFVQGTYGKSTTDAVLAPFNARGSTAQRRITIFSDNPYLRPEIAAQIPDEMDGSPGSFTLSRFGRDFLLMTVDQSAEYWSAQLGFEGDLFSDWTWSANYVHGRSELTLSANEPRSRNYYAALDAVVDPDTGNIVCGVTLRNPGLADDCVPFNVLGEGNPSEAALNYVWDDSTGVTVNEMDYFNVNFQGGLFDLPAGTVTMAIGGEYREQSISQVTNSDPAFFDSVSRAEYFEGIRGVPTNVNLFGVTNIGTADGDLNVKEAYAELVIPILQDAAFADSLQLDLAGRITDYETSGQVETYKIGVNWEITDGLRLRGNYSRDIRAPSLFELFSGARSITAGVADPQTNIDSTLQIITGGNPDLNPEVAKTFTLGLVAQPAALPGLTFTADFYDIKITGALANTDAEQTLLTCFNSGGTDQVCDLINRPSPDAFPISVREVQINLDELRARGLDLELGYRTSLDGLLPDLGATVDLRAFVTYLDKFETNGTDLVGFDYPGGARDLTGLPQWKGLLRQTFATDRFSLSFSERFTGSYRINRVYANPEEGEFPNKIYVNMNMAYDLTGDGTQVFLNVQNLFDVEPPVRPLSVVTNLQATTDKRAYDIIGRYFTAGVRFKF